MKKIFMKTFLIASFITALLIAYSQEFNKMLTVTSSIEYSTSGEIVIKTGELIIPEGYLAVNLKFKYYDPLSGKTIEKIHHSHIVRENNKPLKSEGEIKIIPEGKYKLQINGSPGAFAVLIYDLEHKKE